MKRFLALLTVIAFTAGTVLATEPLLLDPISPEVLNSIPGAVHSNVNGVTDANGVSVAIPGQNGIAATYDPNMIPQNAAAKGQPVPKKRVPRVRIVTKQGRQTNTQWNPGGKGTKSFF